MTGFSTHFKIGERWVGEGEPCYLIAEAGINHNGSMEIAKKLVDVAALAKADAVKFQKRNIEKVWVKEVLDAPYNASYAFGPTYREHRQKIEFSEEQLKEIAAYCRQQKISFFASPWDEDSVEVLERVGVPAYKIASPDLTNLPLVEYIAKKRKPVFLSTGMSTMDEVRTSVELVGRYAKELVLMHCVSTYPSDFKTLNLRCMETLRKEFNCLVGYSGHELGIAMPVAAAALGAVAIERHITLDRAMKGADHAASLEPGGILRLVRDIREVEAAMGDGVKKMLPEEVPIREKLGKSIVAAVDIKSGAPLSREMLAMKSPAKGLPPTQLDSVLGKSVKRDIPADTIIKKEDVNW